MIRMKGRSCLLLMIGALLLAGDGRAAAAQRTNPIGVESHKSFRVDFPRGSEAAFHSRKMFGDQARRGAIKGALVGAGIGAAVGFIAAFWSTHQPRVKDHSEDGLAYIAVPYGAVVGFVVGGVIGGTRGAMRDREARR